MMNTPARRLRAVDRPSSRWPTLSIGTASPLVDPDDSDLYAARTAATTLSTLVVTAWYRLLNKPSLKTRTTHKSARPFPLPYDIVEIIIAHLVYNIRAIKACSLTCRSWYTAAAPQLHYALTLMGDKPEIGHRQLEPLSKIYELDLIHLVKEIRLRQELDEDCWFLPQSFTSFDLRHFSALVNVHTLKLENLEINRFIPAIELHFGHFSQTLRSITLYDPWCTPRQLSHFLSLFSNLDDIGIWNTLTRQLITTTPDMELVPFSALKPQGRLGLYNFNWAETLTHLITSGSDLRFRHMDLRGSSSCVPILFEACAETLETLRFMDGSVSELFRIRLSTDLC